MERRVTICLGFPLILSTFCVECEYIVKAHSVYFQIK